MEIDNIFNEKLGILAKKLSVPVEPLREEFEVAYTKIAAQKNLTLKEIGKQKAAYHKLLGIYTPLLKSKKFIGVVYAKENYFNQTGWLDGKAKLIVKTDGKESAKIDGWLNDDGKFCDGRSHLDNARQIVNPQHKKPIQTNRGNRTVRMFGFKTNELGNPVGKLQAFSVSLNGFIGTDENVTNNKIPMNVWTTFYANIKETQKDDGYLALKFPRQFVFKPLLNGQVEEYELPTVYDGLIELIGKKPHDKYVMDVENLNAVALEKVLSKNYDMIITKVTINQVSESNNGRVVRLTVDNGVDLSLESDDSIPDDYPVFVPSYIYDQIKFGSGSNAVAIGQATRAVEKDPSGNVVTDALGNTKYRDAVIRAFNILGVPGETIEIETNDITDTDIQKMSNGDSSKKLDTVSIASDDEESW